MNNLQIIHHRELPRRRPTPRTHCSLRREEMESSVTGSEDSGANISLSVKFSGRTIPITNLSPDSTIKDLKSLLQPLTNVLPRGQKLICKGKLLVDGMTLKESEVANGSRIMLMASQGLHQGDGPILKQAPTRPISRANNAATTLGKEKTEVSVDKNRLDRWKATGVIGLRDYNLRAIPDEVWACGASARVIELSNNAIPVVPAKIGCLSSLQKLFLSANDILDNSINWEALVSLKFLTVLSLDQNHLTTLPPALGLLTSLKQFHVANNKLSSLPNEIGLLTKLEVLKVNNNRISTMPTSIGDCIGLFEIDVSSNLLSELPETFGNLHNLKSVCLSNNGLKSLPSTLFKKCLQLTTLDLHNTEITMDVLRQTEGWESFDERRRLKHQKQLDFRVVNSGAFDEGADKS